MPRMHKVTQPGSGRYSDPITPNMKRYRMGCCDCGLVHDLQFTVIKVMKVKRDGSFRYKEVPSGHGVGKYRVKFRARRNARSTANIRKANPKKRAMARKRRK